MRFNIHVEDKLFLLYGLFALNREKDKEIEDAHTKQKWRECAKLKKDQAKIYDIQAKLKDEIEGEFQGEKADN